MLTQDQPRNDLALAEAALFLAPQPLTRRALAKILGDVALAYVDQLLEDLRVQFADSSRGIEIHIDEGRAMFRVKAAYVNQVAHLAPQQDIPRPELRTLAVIAYNHPMTQADLIKVRGNKGYKHVQELIERHLITAEDHGRTQLLSVTKDFLRHFGLNSVEEFRFHFAVMPEDEADNQGAVPADLQIDSINDSPASQRVNLELADVEVASSTETTDESRSPEADENLESSASDVAVDAAREDEAKEEPSEEVRYG